MKGRFAFIAVLAEGNEGEAIPTETKNRCILYNSCLYFALLCYVTPTPPPPPPTPHPPCPRYSTCTCTLQ
jgi:hypothetical protein